jgi:3-phenylpropionate/trans-cinnamate dioxygenase ferredoxin reductase subunit
VVGVGVAPDTGWLAGSGIELHRGIVCDAAGRSSDPHVLALGDVACRHDGGDCVWSAHWTPASEQAQVVAGTILGRETPPKAHDGYFWSDQYGSKLQFAGVVDPTAPVRVVSGAVEDRRLLAEIGPPGAPSAVFAIGAAREFVRARIDLRRRPPLERAA